MEQRMHINNWYEPARLLSESIKQYIISFTVYIPVRNAQHHAGYLSLNYELQLQKVYTPLNHDRTLAGCNGSQSLVFSKKRF